MASMPEVSQQLVDKVFAIAAEFQQIALLIRGAPPEFFVSVNTSAQVAAMLAAGKCLNGGHDVPQDMDVIRGMCRECYNAAKNAMIAGDVSETQLIALGLLTAEKSKGGRKRTLRESPLRQLIEGRPLVAAADDKGLLPQPFNQEKISALVDEPIENLPSGDEPGSPDSSPPKTRGNKDEPNNEKLSEGRRSSKKGS